MRQLYTDLMKAHKQVLSPFAPKTRAEQVAYHDASLCFVARDLTAARKMRQRAKDHQMNEEWDWIIADLERQIIEAHQRDFGCAPTWAQEVAS